MTISIQTSRRVEYTNDRFPNAVNANWTLFAYYPNEAEAMDAVERCSNLHPEATVRLVVSTTFEAAPKVQVSAKREHYTVYSDLTGYGFHVIAMNADKNVAHFTKNIDAHKHANRLNELEAQK